MRAYLSTLVTGWDVAQVRAIVADTLHELIEQHHAAGHDVVIVSSSGAEVVEPIGEMLGADHVVATRVTITDGRFTGEIEEYVYGPAKAEAVRRLAAQHGYDLTQCFADSDSVTDLPMLEAVGHPTAVNPDRALRREAVRRGWPVRTFTRPVPLRRGVGRLPVSRPQAAVAALGAGAAGLAWYAGRRRTRRAEG